MNLDLEVPPGLEPEHIEGLQFTLVGNTVELWKKGDDSEAVWFGLEADDDELLQLHKSLSWTLYHRGLAPKPELEA